MNSLELIAINDNHEVPLTITDELYPETISKILCRLLEDGYVIRKKD